MRERGLKCHCRVLPLPLLLGRSREGAWIEMQNYLKRCRTDTVAPVRERGLKYGRTACVALPYLVAPVRERGLKFFLICNDLYWRWVAPVRERGLKLLLPPICWRRRQVAPVRERGLKSARLLQQQDCQIGRSREGAWIEIA